MIRSFGPYGKPSCNYQVLGLRKDDTDLLDVINKQLADMHTSGKLLSILQQFGYTEHELPLADVTATKLCAA